MTTSVILIISILENLEERQKEIYRFSLRPGLQMNLVSIYDPKLGDV